MDGPGKEELQLSQYQRVANAVIEFNKAVMSQSEEGFKSEFGERFGFVMGELGVTDSGGDTLHGLNPYAQLRAAVLELPSLHSAGHKAFNMDTDIEQILGMIDGLGGADGQTIVEIREGFGRKLKSLENNKSDARDEDFDRDRMFDEMLDRIVLKALKDIYSGLMERQERSVNT